MPLIVESGTLTTFPLLARDVLAYHLAEELTRLLICFAVVFSPWAFGTTEGWSLWTMRGCGFCLGLLLGLKLFLRWIKGYGPAGWQGARKAESGWVVVRGLALLTILILLYCLVAALNARAVFDPVSGIFEYRGHLRGLPSSFESRSSWDAFWNYLSLACCFWAIRDWLLGKTRAELRVHPGSDAATQRPGWLPGIPARLQCLLWVLCLSGGVLALEGIAQRVSDCPKLLFLVAPEIHRTAETQFASYAYRANGAQYFNLLWPVCLSFWWALVRSGPPNTAFRHLPLVCAAMMAFCPLISGARGAALVDLIMIPVAMLVLLGSTAGLSPEPGPIRKRPKVLLMLFLLGVPVIGLGLGERQLLPRLSRVRIELGDRERLYESARPMARDYPLFGTGPGTFELIFQLYRPSPDAYWPAQLHNDWLETRITFGWAGSALIAIAALAVLLHPFLGSKGIPCEPQFAVLLCLAMVGCLIQARWDFPLQIYSILLLFLVWSAVLSALSLQKRSCRQISSGIAE